MTRRCVIPGPYDKFEEAFEKFQTELRAEVHEELSSFRGELLQEIRQLATGEPFDPDAFRQELLRDIREMMEENADPFDPTVFRYEILRDIQQLFDEFRQQLTLSLEGAQTLPPFAHVSEDEPTPKKQSWMDKPITWLDKPLFKKET